MFIRLIRFLFVPPPRYEPPREAPVARPVHTPRPTPAAPPPVRLPAATRELSGKAYVIDGDTIIIAHTKIRLAGIDAPEIDMPWGRKAKWEMVRIVKGQIVTARLTGEVSYDRLVARCYLADGRDIGAELVSRGLALDFTHFSGGCYRHLEPPGARRRLHGCGHFGRDTRA